jgi:transcriptional regulator with XRE-family HTH domain
MAMSFGRNIQAWRVSRGHSVPGLAARAGVPPDTLEAVESGECDPSVSMLDTLASALGIPAAWMFADPKHLDLLTTDSDGDVTEAPERDHPDPVTERILQSAGRERELYVLLTVLLQNGDPGVIRAAEASLRSLVKQARRPTVPWQSRPSGHFEPPSD